MKITYTFFIRNKYDEIIGEGQTTEKNLKKVLLNMLDQDYSIDIFKADNRTRDIETTINFKPNQKKSYTVTTNI